MERFSITGSGPIDEGRFDKVEAPKPQSREWWDNRPPLIPLMKFITRIMFATALIGFLGYAAVMILIRLLTASFGPQ